MQKNYQIGLYTRSGLLFLSFCCTSLLSCSQPIKADTKKVAVKKINGLSFVASPKTITENDVINVLQINANWVSLMPFAFIRDVDSPRIQYNSQRQCRGERIEGIKETALAFKEKGVRVMLKPQIWVGHGRFTGHIEMKTEKDWKMLELDI